MSDLSVSSGVSSAQQTQWAQRRSLFDQLGQALQAGDLAGAKKAFAALQASAPQGPQTSQGGSGNNASQNPFAALADALQNGDLAAAQQAFGQIQQSRGHHHRHRQASEATPTAPTATPAATTTTSAATTSSTSGGASSQDSDGDNDGLKGRKINLTA